MSDIEIDLLQQHPTNQVLNNEQASYSGSNKFRNTESIPSRQLRVHSRYDHDGYVGSSWDALLPECGDDYLRRDSTTYEPNPRAAWVLNVEADGADYFKQEISGPVMSKFVDSPQLFNQSEMGPPAGRSGKFIDTVYYWRNPGERSGDTKHVAFIGDFTRNVLIPQLWLSGSIEQNSNQVALSRELRGGSGSQSDSLAIEYDCPQIFCFDMRTFLFLQFRAKKQEELKKSDCLVDCWVFRRVENDDHFMEPIREVVYRFIVQGIRRTQCYGFPTANIYGLRPTTRLFFNGEPVWRREDGKSAPGHPSGCYRAADETNGALAWKGSDGSWLPGYNGSKVYDSHPLWCPESSSDEGSEMDIYDAN